LRAVFAFIGIADAKFVYVGNDEFGGERRRSRSKARAKRCKGLQGLRELDTANPWRR